jgi:hypothetical protein
MVCMCGDLKSQHDAHGNCFRCPCDIYDPRHPDADLRERLGRLVREVWVDWAKEQPVPKNHWLLPWEVLSEADKEVDRRIGEAVYILGRAERMRDKRR